MSLNLIAASSNDGIIGELGTSSLLWKQRADMIFFKAMTTGQIVVMGNNTFKSMGSIPLPNRINVVLTKEKVVNQPGSLYYINDLEKLSAFTQIFERDIFIIGGSSIYDLFLKEFYIDNIYLTTLDVNLKDSVTNPAYFKFDMNKYDVKHIDSGSADDKNTYDWIIGHYSRRLS